jgi:hypothetical protein
LVYQQGEENTMAVIPDSENEYLAYEWGDYKNPDYVEWLLNIVDDSE